MKPALQALVNIIDSPVLLTYAALLGAALIGVELVSRLESIRLKRIAVICLSVLLLCWLDIRSLLVLTLFSTTILLAVRARFEFKNIIYPISLLLIVLLLLIKALSPLVVQQSLYIPLGISYYFFRLISFLIEYSKNPQRFYKISALEFYSWVFFLPVLLAGPILRYDDFKPLEPDVHQQKKATGYRNLAGAIAIKLLIVDLILYNLAYGTLLGMMELKLYSTSQAGLPAPNILFLFAFSFSAFIHSYLDLMIYTEISKAMATILGFTNVENFDRPLLATNISSFWQRWHISLSSWTRDYVFFPMLIKTRLTWLSTYASMLILGLWHAASINWIVWALAHATAINFYGAWRKTSIFQFCARYPTGARLLRGSGNIVTISFVGLVFIFVAIPDFNRVLDLLGKCF